MSNYTFLLIIMIGLFVACYVYSYSFQSDCNKAGVFQPVWCK